MIKLDVKYIEYYIKISVWFLENYFDKTKIYDFDGHFLKRFLDKMESQYSKIISGEIVLQCNNDELRCLKEALHCAKEDYKENNLDKTVLVEIDNYLRNLT